MDRKINSIISFINNHQQLATAVLFGIVGSTLLVVSHATTTKSSIESEDGVKTGNVIGLSDATASNAKGVKFGIGSNGTWLSGVTSDNLGDFANWRGRPLDISGTWPNRDNWANIGNPDNASQVSALAAYKQIWVGVAMLPDPSTPLNPAPTFAQCAAGNFNQYYQNLGSKMVSLGRGNAIIRLGWEANGNWYSWAMGGVGNTSSLTGQQISDYIGCFRAEATAIRQTAPNIVFDWNMNKESKIGTTNVTALYPGDDVVNIIGVDFYDNYPSYPTVACWNNDYNSTQNGGPRGIGSWLTFAKAHNKKFSIPEWGLNNQNSTSCNNQGTDDPNYIQEMYSFLSINSADIAYETYFNLQSPQYVLYPTTPAPPFINPLASAKYRSLWVASPRPQ